MTTEMLSMARKVALEAHEDQLYGELPYIVHLYAVEMVLRRFGITDERLLISAYLHDVLEDTDYEPASIKGLFGEEVLDIVQAVTEPDTGTRKERHAVTYPKIKHHSEARLLKLADRIANVESGGKTDMYRKEQTDFYVALCTGIWISPVEAEMWKHLVWLLVRA
jgi:guanosine-3',5'-bis(diphosphate) 3'-pyrophosphohydrolase